MRRKAKLTAEIGGKRYACVPSGNCSGCAFEPECRGSREIDTPMVECANGPVSPCVKLDFRYEELPPQIEKGGPMKGKHWVIVDTAGLFYTGDTGRKATGWSFEADDAVLFATENRASLHMRGNEGFGGCSVREV